MQKKIKSKKPQFFQNNIVIFDIETYPNIKNYHEPYLLVLYSEKETKIWFKEKTNDKIVRKFIDYLFKNYKGYTVFAHNMKDFDGRFVLDELFISDFQSKKKTCLFKDQHIMTINLKYNITIKDSVLLLPDSLSKLAKNFKLPINKGELPHHLINEKTYKKYKEEAIKYCVLDCKVLYHVLLEFEKLSRELSPVNPLSCLTLPQFAFNTFLSNKFFPEDWELYRLDKTKYDFVASGYYGGRVDVFITCLEYETDKIHYFDVNSLYPFSMTKSMPEGEGSWEKAENINIDSFFGFVEVTVKTPENIHIPILPYRWKGSLYFPKGVFRGVHFSEELKYALRNGYEIIKIHSALKFEKRENVFEKYVETFYEKKKEEAVNKGGLYYIIKLLLNGLYGRFGMKQETTEYVVVDPEKVTEFYKYYTIHGEIQLKNALLLKISDTPPIISQHIKNFFYKKEKNAPKITSFNIHDKSPAHVSAAIASYSRIVLDQCIRTLGEENIAYTDTDSVITTKTLPEDLIDPVILGKWKLEGLFKKFFCFGPKAYSLVNTKGAEIDRLKGITRDQVKEAVSALKKDNIYTSKEKKNFLKEIKSMKIKTNVETQKTVVAYTTKKRKFIKGETYTKPLIAPNDFIE